MLDTIQWLHGIDKLPGTEYRNICYCSIWAQVAELVDALDSGSSGGNPVEVQVLFWAVKFRNNYIMIPVLIFAYTFAVAVEGLAYNTMFQV